MVKDPLGRKFRNLRVSLTAACNYACTYCVPDGRKLQPLAEELSAESLLQLVRLLMETAGVDRLRITGGEPLVSPKFDEFLAGASELELSDLAITTNGQLLLQKEDAIRNSSLRRINVSLDTLDQRQFREMARGGELQTVIAGIDAMMALGRTVKVNSVPMRSHNLDQVLPLLEHCLSRGIEIRFIELMNMGHLKYNRQYQSEFVSMNELLGMIRSKFVVRRTFAPADSTSMRYEIPGAGTFGIIANESEPFCSECSRLRLASNGRLFGCLSNVRSHSVRHLLDLPGRQAVAGLEQVLAEAMSDKQRVAFTGETTVMKFIGG